MNCINICSRCPCVFNSKSFFDISKPAYFFFLSLGYYEIRTENPASFYGVLLLGSCSFMSKNKLKKKTCNKSLSNFDPTASKLVLFLSLFSVMAVTFHQPTRLKITINCSSRSNHFFADRLQPELDYITSSPGISS